MHDIIQKSKRLFNKLENEKNKYEDLTYCDDENKIIAINKILNNKLIIKYYNKIFAYLYRNL
jgi:hypothetical protein